MNPLELNFYRYSVPILTPILSEKLLKYRKVQKIRQDIHIPQFRISSTDIFTCSLLFLRKECLYINLKSTPLPSNT